jgi:hypothetical protein
MKGFIRLAFALAFLFVGLGCKFKRASAPTASALWIWVPEAGPRRDRIQSLTQELGLQARFLETRELMSLGPNDFQGARAILCFEGDHEQGLAGGSIRTVLRQGGALLLAGDSAAFLEKPLGFKLRTVEKGSFVWQSQVRHLLAPGSFNHEDGTAWVYGYERKDVPGWYLENLPVGDVWATDDQGRARWMETDYQGGRIVIAAAPLATLASNTDSQGARLLLERAAELAKLPRLWPTPQGKGGVIVNIHVDSGAHIPYLKKMLTQWPTSVRGTFHITAGPDDDHEGDGKGFDVGNPLKGKPWVPKLWAIGEVGSHGGWAHNLWGAEAANWSEERREKMLELNHVALESFGPLRSYSSPLGLHPPAINSWLEQHGIRSIYQTGDAGSPPTRTWQNDRPIANSLWSFPVATDGDSASVPEFRSSGKGESEALRWGLAMVDFCERERTLRLMYGHTIEWGDMPKAYHGWLDRLGERASAGGMTARTMNEYTAFLDRHLGVHWSFEPQGDQALLKASGTSLQDMAFRLPGVWKLSAEKGIRMEQKDDWTWVVIEDARDHFEGKLTR